MDRMSRIKTENLLRQGFYPENPVHPVSWFFSVTSVANVVDFGF
jgi:hypothetical protein